MNSKYGLAQEFSRIAGAAIGLAVAALLSAAQANAQAPAPTAEAASEVKAEPSDAASVKYEEEKVFASKDGEFEKLETNILFPHDILISTNGTYRVQKGKPRDFTKGQVLSREGILTSPNGATYPVYDHLKMNKGRVQEMKDGQYRPLSQVKTLPNGAVIFPDGYIKRPGQAKIRLLDGQLFKMDGTSIPAQDTISMNDGKVSVQKDGALFPVRPRGSIVMSDGTRVFGTGKVVKPSGETIQLKEGQILKVEGVRRN